MQNAIDFIQKLIERGCAYELDGYVVCDSSNWVAFSTVNAYPIPAPIQYPILRGNMQSPLDFPLWAPYVDGHPSPWGKGNATVNVAYIRSLTSL
jgi:cysteinyl-tRNA synthetase